MRYTLLTSRIWHDEKYRQLPLLARHVFIYLLSSPHANMVGLYYLPTEYACHDTQLNREEFNHVMGELEAQGLIRRDGEIIFIKNFLKYNPIRGQKQVVGAANRFKDVPKTHLKKEFLRNLQEQIGHENYELFIESAGEIEEEEKEDPLASSEPEKTTHEPAPEPANEEERQALEVLKSVEGYRPDPRKDLDMLRSLIEEFPQLDLNQELKKWRDYKRDRPLKKNSSPRLQIRNWMQKAIEFQKERRGTTHERERAPARSGDQAGRFREFVN